MIELVTLVHNSYFVVVVWWAGLLMQHAGGGNSDVEGGASRNDGADGLEDGDGGSYDSKMRQAVKKKLGHEEKTWEEELDEEESKVARKT